MPVMCQRHVARAAIIKFLHPPDILTNGIAVLDANKRNFFSFGVDPTYVRGCKRHLDFVERDLLCEPMDRVELLDGSLVGALITYLCERIRTQRLSRLADENTEEHCVEATLEHLGQIHLGIKTLRVVPLSREICRREVDMCGDCEDAS